MLTSSTLFCRCAVYMCICAYTSAHRSTWLCKFLCNFLCKFLCKFLCELRESSTCNGSIFLCRLLTLGHVITSQVLDEGRLTDSKGRTVSFAQTFIVLTSNLGSRHLFEHFDKGRSTDADTVPEVVKELVTAEARRHFRPEFLNRLDDILVFAPLSDGALARVAQRAVQVWCGMVWYSMA